ncbi:porin [Shewanella sp. HN-41]|uniref:porin n=1 Tax=Shewanella sp. HN-41 TaxID=327275 RepID=UPI0002125FC6|nr:porin [Shewanella sp. HN-41]EGM71445.1 porin [Shewanella sp. HN-41]
MINNHITPLKTVLILAMGLCTTNAYSTENEVLTTQVEALNQRIAQLEQNSAPSQFKNSQVSLYGSIRPTLSYLDQNDEQSWDVRDALSRVGIKASTEFADGWRAIAQGEWSVDIANSGNLGKARQAYAAIMSPYGQVGIGKQRPAQYTLVAEYVDIFNHGNSPYAYDHESPFFVDNFVTYQLVTGGFTWMAGAQVDGNKGDTNVDMINLGVGYDTGALHLGLGYVTQDTLTNEQVDGDNQTFGGAAAYTFNNGLYLAVSYQDKQYNFDNQTLSVDRSGSTLDTALAYPFSDEYKIKLGYFQFKDGIDGNDSADYNGFNTTLEWNPLDNVRVHLEYLNKDLDNGQDDQAVTIGFRYDFNLTWQG